MNEPSAPFKKGFYATLGVGVAIIVLVPVLFFGSAFFVAMIEIATKPVVKTPADPPQRFTAEEQAEYDRLARKRISEAMEQDRQRKEERLLKASR